MFMKITLIGRLGQNADAKTAQNNKDYVVLNIATQESWKNDKGDYETRTEWHRASVPGAISRSSPKLSRKGSSSPSKEHSGIARSPKTSRANRSSTASLKFMRQA